MLERVWRKEYPLILLVGMYIGATTKENTMEIPQKTENRTTIYDPATPLLGLYLDKTLIQKDICIPMFIAALFTIAKTWKHPVYRQRSE